MSERTTQVIPLAEPEISGKEWKYVRECLDSGWVSSAGQYVDRFEEMTAGYLGCSHAVAVINGTSALHLALLASGVLPGDEVIVPTLTFIAPVNAIKYCGGEPVFMDCDPDTLCLHVPKTLDFLEKACRPGDNGELINRKTGKRVRAILPVHVFGHPVDMEPLLAVSRKYTLEVIEDAAESIGSEYRGVKTGTMGRCGCLSFNGNKIVTTGGGGMVATNDRALAQRVKHLSTQAKKNAFEYDHDEIGYNYRLSNLAAAMGVAQMERLEEFIERKRHNAALYREAFAPLPEIRFTWEKEWARSNFWFYTIQVPGAFRDSMIGSLVNSGIQVRPPWKPIHTLPMYRNCQAYAVESAQEIYKSCLNIPCSISLDEEQVDRVVRAVKECLGRSS